MLYYSQNFEDVYLWRCFKGDAGGFYVDVGAYHPVEESVTKIFYDAGWRGVNLDPSQSAITAFSEQREGDLNLGLLAWDVDDQELEFYVSASTGRSTADPFFKACCDADGIALVPMQVRTVTLNTVLAGLSISEFSFLKIDAEGAELRVLAGIDLSRFRPRVIVIESVDPHQSPLKEDEAIDALLIGAHYHLALFDGINKYWVADACSDLDRHFRLPPGCLDGIRPYQVYEAQKRAEGFEQQLRAIHAASTDNTAASKLSFLLVSHASPGLIQDQDVVAAVLRGLGHAVYSLRVPTFYFQQQVELPLPGELSEGVHVIMFEHVFLFDGAVSSRSLYVNPEWLLPEDINRIESGRVDLLLVKSRDAETRLSARFAGLQVIYTGFASLPLLHPQIEPDYRLALHARGNASQKGTQAVLSAYASDRRAALPACVCTMRTFDPAVPSFSARIGSRCTLVFRDIAQNGFARIARRRGIHLCPSEREGFGHYIFGPMLAGAIVVTTDAAPMNELVDAGSGLLLAADLIDRDLYCDALVRPATIKAALLQLAAMTHSEKQQLGDAARDRASRLQDDFQQRLQIFVTLLACFSS